MMHADLIDQDDLIGQLRSIGFETPSGASAEQACAQVVCGLTEDRARALRQLVERMLSGSATILPAVRQAIDQQLLPALATYNQGRVQA
ncbi:hypothetical protein [Pseudomonas sp. NFR16]|uniref:hypothetical protein n=1 Tax=Pseudomonas sp. NFR16 TaxID=1566248 RepID=UPI0008CA4F22|nr:hypothetical protein [Pseudomonas sp. NFR16]SEJ56311.1 hypothetical protein SAMN03159495_3762 [Pseudomonas sp. NFR16]